MGLLFSSRRQVQWLMLLTLISVSRATSSSSDEKQVGAAVPAKTDSWESLKERFRYKEKFTYNCEKQYVEAVPAKKDSLELMERFQRLQESDLSTAKREVHDARVAFVDKTSVVRKYVRQ